VKFETFCAPRIRGAILDHLRASDWAPRLVRARTRTVGIARDQLRKKWGREPTEEEVAKHMGLSLAEYRKIAPDAVPTVVKPLQQTIRLNDSDRQMTEAEVVPDTRQLNPRSVLQKRDALDLLTRRLTRAERLIVVLYYYEELTMKEIGATLDLSESRVSQMHSSILARLRAQMQNRDSELCGEAA
ncbi:MAG: sigma-70 family RNA polymerase sigma factor, partial [Phycisphaerae bacterium]|nr:sigma-70 family RNA polymerase sigma factor [Phycisphaerae bacterium]